MYWVLWNTRNARPARKSRDDNKPATGRSVKPVQSVNSICICTYTLVYLYEYSVDLCNVHTFQEARYILQLRNVILPVAAVLHQQREHMVVLFTCVRRIQLCQLAEHRAPRGCLLLGVVHVWQRLAVSVMVGNVGKVLPASPVHRVRESRMIRIQFSAITQDLVSEPVQVTDTSREPWYSIYKVYTRT